MQSYISLNPSIFDTLIIGKSYTIKRTYTVEKNIKKQNEPKEYETEVDIFTGTLTRVNYNCNIPQIQIKDNQGCNHTLSGAWTEYEICPIG